MNIALAIMHLYPQANPITDFIVQDDSDGEGPYIAAWNLEDPQPTEEELLEAWEALNTVSLPQYKQEKIEYLSTLRDIELTSGFTSTVERSDVLLEFGYSEKAQFRFSKQLGIVNSNPMLDSINWLTLNVGFVTLTREEFISVVNSGAEHEIDIEFKMLYAEANIINSTTTESIDAVVDSW